MMIKRCEKLLGTICCGLGKVRDPFLLRTQGQRSKIPRYYYAFEFELELKLKIGAGKLTSNSFGTV